MESIFCLNEKSLCYSHSKLKAIGSKSKLFNQKRLVRDIITFCYYSAVRYLNGRYRDD